MNLSNAVIELDLHGLTVDQAEKRVERAVASADGGVYIIRVIHGFNRGTAIRTMLNETYGRGYDRKVIRVRPGSNPGTTELMLKEM
ncbi:MAG: Smr/MutS family protein [Lachnospiraceae bacterium]|nr:Smr/MutS family protein [Lachnospiraceae bacterium]